MRRELRILQISFLIAFLWVSQKSAEAQILASTAATSKVARMNMAEGIASNNRELLNLITKAGLMPVLSSNGEYTFFAPPAEAMSKLQEKTPERLKELFLKHIVVGTITSANFHDGSVLKTMDGGSLKVFRKKDMIFVDGLQVTDPDQRFSNGVLHQLSGTMKIQPSDL